MFPNAVLMSDVIAGLKALPPRSVDILIADPPYNVGKDFGGCKDRMALDAYVRWCMEWIDEGVRVLKPTGTFYIYGFSEILAHLLVNATAEFNRWLVWHYTNKNAANATYWQRSHEAILVLAHQQPTFNVDLVREPYTDDFLKNTAGRKRSATPGRFSDGLTETVYVAHAGGALPRDVLKHPTLAGSAGSTERARWCEDCDTLVIGLEEKRTHAGHSLVDHPTQKPIALTRRLIAAAKNVGGETNVAVLFAGSGAECIAAQEEGCNFIGFDIEPKYVRMANAWIGRADSTQVILAAAEATAPTVAPTVAEPTIPVADPNRRQGGGKPIAFPDDGIGRRHQHHEEFRSDRFDRWAA